MKSRHTSAQFWYKHTTTNNEQDSNAETSIDLPPLNVVLTLTLTLVELLNPAVKRLKTENDILVISNSFYSFYLHVNKNKRFVILLLIYQSVNVF